MRAQPSKGGKGQKKRNTKGGGTSRVAGQVQASQQSTVPTAIPGESATTTSSSHKGHLCQPQPPARPLQLRPAPVLVLATPDGPSRSPTHKPGPGTSPAPFPAPAPAPSQAPPTPTEAPVPGWTEELYEHYRQWAGNQALAEMLRQPPPPTAPWGVPPPWYLPVHYAQLPQAPVP